jgi:hypothetical protein
MVVAVVAAVRTAWKDDGNVKDEGYFLRNAQSNVWYSSEIVGTIIVQCIPVLRPLIRDIHTSLTSKKLPSTFDGTDAQSTTIWSKQSSKRGTKDFLQNQNKTYSVGVWAQHSTTEAGDYALKGGDRMELGKIREESVFDPFNEGQSKKR